MKTWALFKNEYHLNDNLHSKWAQLIHLTPRDWTLMIIDKRYFNDILVLS